MTSTLITFIKSNEQLKVFAQKFKGNGLSNSGRACGFNWFVSWMPQGYLEYIKRKIINTNHSKQLQMVCGCSMVTFMGYKQVAFWLDLRFNFDNKRRRFLHWTVSVYSKHFVSITRKESVKSFIKRVLLLGILKCISIKYS